MLLILLLAKLRYSIFGLNVTFSSTYENLFQKLRTKKGAEEAVCFCFFMAFTATRYIWPKKFFYRFSCQIKMNASTRPQENFYLQLWLKVTHIKRHIQMQVFIEVSILFLEREPIKSVYPRAR